MTRWLAPDALPGRVHPDPTEAAAGRIEGGAAVEELARTGAWVRVRDPDGGVWWVDGRRLEPLAAAERPIRGEGLPWPLVAIAVLGIGLLSAGVTALLVTGGDDSVSTSEGSASPTSLLVPTTATPLATVTTAPPTTEAPTTTTVASTTTVPQIRETAIPLGETFEPTRGIRSPRVAGLAVGSTGIWAMRPETGVLYRIDPSTNEVSLSAAVADSGTSGTEPALAVGHGSVWVTEEAMDEVIRVDEDSGEITGRISVGEGANDVVTTSDAVWVAIDSFTGVDIARIDPATNAVTRRHRLTDDAAYEVEIVAAHGAIWARYSWSGDGWVVRVEPSTGEATATAEVTCVAGLAAHGEAVLAIDGCPGGGGLHLVSIDAESGSIVEQHRLAAGSAIDSDGERLAMKSAFLEPASVAWWTGPLDEPPRIHVLTEPADGITDLLVDETTVWLATSGSRLLIRIDGLWGVT